MSLPTRACDVENLTDFCRYYQSSFVGWHPTDGEFILPALIGGQLSDTSILLRFLSKQETTFQLQPNFQASWKDILDHVDFGLPDIGMFPDGPTLTYCGYYSPRAAKKGFRTRELSLTDFNKWAIRSRYSQKDFDSNARVWHAFNPEYKSLSEAVKAIEEGLCVGVPINRMMGVYTLPKFKVPLFAYKRWSVGHVEGADTIVLKAPFNEYATEIERQTGAKVVVG